MRHKQSRKCDTIQSKKANHKNVEVSMMITVASILYSIMGTCQ